jgi:hypothetical protein
VDTDSTLSAPSKPSTTDQEDDLAWEVDDPFGTTVYNESLGCLQTRLPSGLIIGWDTCGCGRPVQSCGCDPIKISAVVVKLRHAEELEQAEKALRDREKAEQVDVVDKSAPTPQRRSRAKKKAT